MALPKINQPLFEIEIPSTGQKVKYRPFKVKEEKILLIAQESKEIDQMILAIKQIMTSCIQDDIDVENLAVFDLEYLLINIRARSVNNMIEFKIRDPDTKEEIDLKIDLADIAMTKDKKHTNKISLDENSTLLMKYPKLHQLDEIVELSEMNSVEKLNFLQTCLDKLVVGDEVYDFSEYSSEEVGDFMDDLSTENLDKLKNFFETMPSLSYEAKYVTKEGKNKTFVVKGTETFFI